MRRDDRFRFSLQWSADTEEKAKAGTLLERLGNKKSDFIVLAVVEYLHRHPEMEILGAIIKITYVVIDKELARVAKRHRKSRKISLAASIKIMTS